ncbi:MAG TPA: hypothetical protein VJI46_01510 [Candidatus Nanoarchaeia archaeon]|nr:hypothetical protein [Candidatus Nanoarchaeia archaeon]
MADDPNEGQRKVNILGPTTIRAEGLEQMGRKKKEAEKGNHHELSGALDTGVNIGDLAEEQGAPAYLFGTTVIDDSRAKAMPKSSQPDTDFSILPAFNNSQLLEGRIEAKPERTERRKQSPLQSLLEGKIQEFYELEGSPEERYTAARLFVDGYARLVEKSGLRNAHQELKTMEGIMRSFNLENFDPWIKFVYVRASGELSFGIGTVEKKYEKALGIIEEFKAVLRGAEGHPNYVKASGMAGQAQARLNQVYYALKSHPDNLEAEVEEYQKQAEQLKGLVADKTKYLKIRQVGVEKVLGYIWYVMTDRLMQAFQVEAKHIRDRKRKEDLLGTIDKLYASFDSIHQEIIAKRKEYS